MEKCADNVTAFPGGSPTAPPAEDQSGASIVIFTPLENDDIILKYILGDSADLSTCSTSQSLEKLCKRGSKPPPNLILIRDLILDDEPELLTDILARVRRSAPVLVLSDVLDEKRVARLMKAGVRDVVSLDEADRLRAVVRRELSDDQVRRAYDRAASYLANIDSTNDVEPMPQTRPEPRPETEPDPQNTDRTSLLLGRDDFIVRLAERLSIPLTRGVRTLAWIRPDQFASTQESVGILASEDALSHIGGVLHDLLHPADICGRLGGTIFAVLVERGTIKDVEAWAQQFCRCLDQRPFVCDGKDVSLSCSVGISETSRSAQTVEDILQDARNASNRGRRNGAGEVCLSKSIKSARSNDSLDKKWGNRIRNALQKNRFHLRHSPVVSLDGSNIRIRDTWVRMTNRNNKVFLAAKFVPVASRIGLMIHIDRWVIGATISYCIKRKPDLVFVRLSKNSMLDDSLMPWLDDLFSNSTVDPSNICFQTSASVALRHMDQIVRQVNKLATLGFSFSVDQVGASAKMLEVLRLVPAQFARISAELLQQVAWDKSAHHEVSTIVNACKNNDIHAIAERVEDAATMAVLCQMGVEYMQGDYLRRDNIVIEDTSTFRKPQPPPIIIPR